MYTPRISSRYVMAPCTKRIEHRYVIIKTKAADHHSAAIDVRIVATSSRNSANTLKTRTILRARRILKTRSNLKTPNDNWPNLRPTSKHNQISLLTKAHHLVCSTLKHNPSTQKLPSTSLWPKLILPTPRTDISIAKTTLCVCKWFDAAARVRPSHKTQKKS